MQDENIQVNGVSFSYLDQNEQIHGIKCLKVIANFELQLYKLFIKSLMIETFNPNKNFMPVR